MERRKFLVGMGALTAGGTAALGTGAFSRVESQRSVQIAVAADPNAYLGITPLNEAYAEQYDVPGNGTANGNNYAHLDDKGHAYLEITDSGSGGYGVNSNSETWFDGLFQVCNQGKDDVAFQLDWGDVDIADGAEIVIYFQHEIGGEIMAEFSSESPEDTAGLLLGTCQLMGIKTITHSVSAIENDTVADGTLKIIADVDGFDEVQ